MVLPPAPTEIQRDEAVVRYLELCRQTALIRRLPPATVRNYILGLHRFLELLPDAQEHITVSVTGEHVDEALLVYANTVDHRPTPAPGETVDDPRQRMAGADVHAKVLGSTLRMRRSLSGFFGSCVDQAFAAVSPVRASRRGPRTGGSCR